VTKLWKFGKIYKIMEDPYDIIIRKMGIVPKCGTPLIQMAQAEREFYIALSKEEKLKWLEEKENYKRKQNILNIIRTVLLFMIIIGIILLCTQRLWVNPLVDLILKNSK